MNLPTITARIGRQRGAGIDYESEVRCSVTKRFKFSAAHRIPGYPGDCSRLHGHTYTAEITAEGDLGEHGMVVDFADLKKAWQQIASELDHRTLNDTITANPSTEAVAIWILRKMRARVPNVRAVRLCEGPDQWAEVEAW